MLYSKFAHSSSMQLILAAITAFETFCVMYMISNVIMTVFQVTPSKKQKVLFALINGPLLQTTLAYGVFIAGGFISFSPIVYLLVVNVNPIGALVYYYSARRIFQLSNERSIKLMRYMLICWATIVTIGRLINGMFRIQTSIGYNYLMDGIQQVSMVLTVYVFYVAGLYALKKARISLGFTDTMLFNKRRELSIYLAESFFIFAINVIVPSVFTDQIAANIIVVLITLLYTAIVICMDVVAYNKQAISNRDVHIGALFRGMEELRGVKHDFNNILHTYSGYLELKEYEKLEKYHAFLVSETSHAGCVMDLAKKSHENRPVIALLIDKLQYAEQMSVRLLVSLKCGLDNLFVDDMDAAKILSCLLDNAIEAASCSEQRKAYLTVESKLADSILIIVAHSYSGSVNEARQVAQNRREERLAHVRDMLNKYGNCMFQMEYRDREVSAYVELRGT